MIALVECWVILWPISRTAKGDVPCIYNVLMNLDLNEIKKKISIFNRRLDILMCVKSLKMFGKGIVYLFFHQNVK